MRWGCVVCLAAALAGAPVAVFGQAQPLRLQSYSLTALDSMLGPTRSVRVSRAGSKELIEQRRAPSPAEPRGLDIRNLYDFAAQKVYVVDLTTQQCTVTRYVSPDAPTALDPVLAAAEIAPALAAQQIQLLGTDTVNGIPAKVFDVALPEGGGTMRYWVESQYSIPLRIVMARPNKQPQTLLEVQTLSFDSPPAGLFVPPSNCTVVAGETSATGGHVELSVEVPPAAGESTGQAQPARAPSPAAPRPSARATAPAPAARVTEVRLLGVRPSPSYKGPYPGSFDFAYAITSDGPAEVKWVLVNQAGIAWKNGTLGFDAAGTKELSVPIKVGVKGKLWEGWTQLEVYTPNQLQSERAPYSVDCRPE